MDNLLVMCTGLTFFLAGNGQLVEYATRFRNCSIESETGSVYLVSLNIYQNNQDHKLSAVVNVTKDIRMKSLEVITNRCSYEKSDCENYQRWKFPSNFVSLVYMKNQMWTPIFAHVIPKLDIPNVKKNIYSSKDITLDTKMVVKFYPEVVNYFWRVDTIAIDHNDRKAAVLKFEGAIVSFVKKNKTRNRGGTRTTKIE